MEHEFSFSRQARKHWALITTQYGMSRFIDYVSDFFLIVS